MKHVSPFVYWAPRVISILFLLFLALFSLDVFGQGNGFWETALAFLIHNIPVIILGVIVWISWKKEIVGAVVFFIAGLAYLGFVLRSALDEGFHWYHLAWAAQIAGAAFLIAWLYYLNWKRK
jgi:hypothetical protein